MRTPTREPFPRDDQGQPRIWARQSFATMQRDVTAIVHDAQTLSPTGDEQYVAIWYRAPGASEDETLGIDVETEFLRQPFTAGTYYIRLGTTHYQCAPMAQSSPGPLAAQMAAERQLENQAATIRRLELRVEEMDTVVVNLRRERNDLTDRVEERGRRVKGLEAALEAALEDANPWIGEEQMVQLLPLFKSWAEGESGNLLEAFFGSIQTLTASMYADKAMMRAIGLRHTEQWNAFRAAFDAVGRYVCAETGQFQRLHSGEEIRAFYQGAKPEPALPAAKNPRASLAGLAGLVGLGRRAIQRRAM
jgi:hypothetical protein